MWSIVKKICMEVVLLITELASPQTVSASYPHRTDSLPGNTTYLVVRNEPARYHKF